MTDLTAYPYVKPWTDGTGKLRYRYRHAGVTKYTTEQPGTDAFDAWYDAVITGQAGAPVVKLRGGILPKTLGDSWQRLRDSRDWTDLDQKTKTNQQPVIEAMLRSEVAPGLKWQDAPWAEVTTDALQHAIDGIEAILHADKHERARNAGRTASAKSNKHAGRLLKIVLHKLAKIARKADGGWMPVNPTLELTAPKRKGKSSWRPWTDAEKAAFEAKHVYGTVARTVYELADWLGTRRSDIATICWEQQIEGVVEGKRVNGFQFIQYKGRNKEDPQAIFKPITEELELALAHIPAEARKGTVLKGGNGKAYDIPSLSRNMYDWTRQAGLEGCVLHGLRKNYGTDMAHGGATLREGMAGGGWVTADEFLRYSATYEQMKGAVAASEKVVALRRFRKAG
jgi:hypothetical protein